MVSRITNTTITRHGVPGLICGGVGSVDFFLAALNLPIRSEADNLTEVIRRRETFSLLLASALLAGSGAGCGASRPVKPDLPASVSPGWQLGALLEVPAPPEIPKGGTPPVCWKADYTGPGTAGIFLCHYSAEAAAFDAVQRVPAEAQAVKFQSGAWFVLAKWNGAAKVDFTALVRAIQKALHVS